MRVIGLVATEAQLRDVMEELAADGIGVEDERIPLGTAAETGLRARSGRRGFLSWLRRIVHRARVREGRREPTSYWRRILRDGDRVVAIGLPDRASTDKVSRVLQAHGGRFISVFGRFAIYRLTD